MREKLLNLMKSEGLTSSRLAEILETQPSGISHILSGRNKPGFDLLQKILRRFPRINPDWLLLDSDKMYRDDAPSGPQAVLTPEVHDLFAAPSDSGTTNPEAPFSASAGRSVDTSSANLRHAQSEAKNTDVVRVVVFYADQTCESFVTKR